jgi:sulfate adenylyltransferase subunit 2
MTTAIADTTGKNSTVSLWRNREIFATARQIHYKFSTFLINLLIVKKSLAVDLALNGQVWTIKRLQEALAHAGSDISLRSTLRSLQDLWGAEVVSRLEEIRNRDGDAFNSLVASPLRDWSQSKRRPVEILQTFSAGGSVIVALSDFKGRLTWVALPDSSPEALHSGALSVLEACQGNYALVPHGPMGAVSDHLELPDRIQDLSSMLPPPRFVPRERSSPASRPQASYLDALESESIEIMRETYAAAEKPAMLFSMGKDSMVMFALALKAFAPGPLPFPLVIIDTRWKFQEMYRFRAHLEAREDLSTVVYVNPEAIDRDMNPFDFGSATHTDVTKTQALKKVLDEHQFDFVFGGARRDEEKSRAKERIFSPRSATHGWDPKAQRPELWNLYNTALATGQSMRVFPISNWTEIDIWRYLEREGVDLVPLYFSKIRAYVKRNNALIMVDDERFPLEEGEKVHIDYVRFRTLGCYPLTGGVESRATSIGDIVAELESSRVSERSSRVIDFDKGASMEQKKKDGYF